MKKTIKHLISFALAIVLLSMEMFTMYALEPTYMPSEPYRKSMYYTKLKNVVLTGNYHADIARVALSQVGYHEGNSDSELGGGNTTGNDNYTEYGYWYGLQDAWCAMFISWCARQAQIPKNIIRNSTFATTSDFGLEFRWKSEYTPSIGDLIIFDYAPYNMVDPGEHGDHVGLVVNVDDEKVYTVEGNAGNSVAYKSYDLTYSEIKGYGIYDEPIKEDITTEAEMTDVSEISIKESSEESNEEPEIKETSFDEDSADHESKIISESTEEKVSNKKIALIFGGAALIAAGAALLFRRLKRKKK